MSHKISDEGNLNSRSSSAKGVKIGLLGMLLLVLALFVLFVASIVGILIVTLREGPPAGIRQFPTPPGLWVSTIVIVLSSLTFNLALSKLRAGIFSVFKLAIFLTLSLGFIFLISQAINWLYIYRHGITAKTSLYGFGFFMLTGLHGAHVIGGLVPLCLVTRNAFKMMYTSLSHSAVLYTSIYWHFLDFVWLIVFLTLIIFW